MVRAVYKADGNTHTLSVSGHAGYGEYGKDIVCAGVSALVQALIGWVKKNPHTAKHIEVNDGNVRIISRGGDDVEAVFYMTAIGVEGISNSYPEHVEIKIIGIDN